MEWGREVARIRTNPLGDMFNRFHLGPYKGGEGYKQNNYFGVGGGGGHETFTGSELKMPGHLGTRESHISYSSFRIGFRPFLDPKPFIFLAHVALRWPHVLVRPLVLLCA